MHSLLNIKPLLRVWSINAPWDNYLRVNSFNVDHKGKHNHLFYSVRDKGWGIYIDKNKVFESSSLKSCLKWFDENIYCKKEDNKMKLKKICKIVKANPGIQFYAKKKECNFVIRFKLPGWNGNCVFLEYGEITSDGSFQKNAFSVLLIDDILETKFTLLHEVKEEKYTLKEWPKGVIHLGGTGTVTSVSVDAFNGA